MSDMSDDEYDYGSGSESSYSFGSDDAKSEGDDGRPRMVAADTLKAMYQTWVENVSELTGLDEDLAGVLLLTVDFNKDATNTDWFDARKSAKLRADAGLDSLCEPGSDADPDLPFSCELCLEDVDFAETHAMACNHRYCKDCYATHIDPESRACVFTRCPNGDCRLAVGRSTMAAVLPSEGFDRYWRWVMQRFVASAHTPALKACPTPGCEQVIHNSDKGSYPEVTCAGCSKRWCFQCREEPHRPATCEQVLAWKEKTNETDLTSLWIKANTKKCPKCDHVINKDAGCQHMTCDRCHHQFCWLCMRPYSEHSEKTGGFYSCHKFAQRVQTEGKTEEEKEVIRAQRTLRNYNMAVERHLAHKQGCASAETDLMESVNRNMDVLTSFGFAVGSFLTDAVAIIIQCRRVLSWSYVYKYYKFLGDGLERELNLFEDYQGLLEQLTRRLHDFVGKDVTCFLPAGRPPKKSGAGSAGAGAGVPSSALLQERTAQFDEFRAEVQRCGAALKRFLSSVLDFEQASKDFSGVEWVERAEAPGSKKRAVWQWEDAHGRWRTFEQPVIDTMEEGLRMGKTVLEIKSNNSTFCVDLVAKSKTNVSTHSSQQIRRVLVDGREWECPACTFHNKATTRDCEMCGRRKPSA